MLGQWVPQQQIHIPTKMPLDPANAQSPGLLRRLAAMTYDLILVLGMLLVAETILTVPYLELAEKGLPTEGWGHRLHQLYLLCVAVGFHCYFWVRGGQTLGMRAWRFRLLRADGQPLTIGDALMRFAWAALTLAPLGLLWMLFDSDRLGLYDRLSRTRPVMLKKD
jgi:uncharacterized RDD family membrane protein YckC